MGHLLNMGIKMQKAAATTATLKYSLATSGFGGTFTVYKNGSVLQTMTTDTALVTVTLNAGDTFYATIASFAGTSIDYFVNSAFVANYFDTSPTPTITAAAGSTYEYNAYFGAV